MSLNLNHISRIHVTKQRENICKLKHFQEVKEQKIRTVRFVFKQLTIALFNYGLLFPRMLNHNLMLIYSIHQLGIGNALNTQANTDDLTQKHSLCFLKIN